MKTVNKILIAAILTIFTTSLVFAGGSGDLKLGYTYLSDKGNLAMSQPTFNDYKGIGLSLENFRYQCSKGTIFRADLKNITLDNRNLNLGIEKAGLWGLNANLNKYRRIYDFEGKDATKRDQFGSDLWVNLNKRLRIFGGFSSIGLKGKIDDSFNLGADAPRQMEYSQKNYNVGARINCNGGMFQAEYLKINYKDKKISDRDQDRQNVRLNALMPVLKNNRLIASGGFQSFETKYTASGFKIKSNTVWGGGLLNLPHHFSVNYNFIFNRAGSDSDMVKTDNIANTVYLNHVWPNLAGLTVGYQNDIRDDFDKQLKSNSYYFSGWVTKNRCELRADYGSRAEDVKKGTRLVGNEDRTRFKVQTKYRYTDATWLGLSYEGKQRKNDDIGSKADFNRFGAQCAVKFGDLFNLNGGYFYATGKYKNIESEFKFTDHELFGDITLKEFCRLTPGFGALYYRSKRDLDIEHFNLRFSGTYRLVSDFELEAIYNVYNFDDFLVSDRYYTSNIVEINLIKGFSF